MSNDLEKFGSTEHLTYATFKSKIEEDESKKADQIFRDFVKNYKEHFIIMIDKMLNVYMSEKRK